MGIVVRDVETGEVVRDSRPIKPRPRKPRPKPARTIRIVEPPTPDTDGWLAAEIREGKKAEVYVIGPIPCGLGEHVAAYEVEKVAPSPEDEGLATPYHVTLDARTGHHTCECLGHLKHGHKTVCRHVAGLLALRAEGKLPTLQTAREARHCPELTYVPCDGYSGDEPPQMDDAAYFDPADLAG